MEPIPAGPDELRDVVVEAVNARDLEILSLPEGIDVPVDLRTRLQRVIERSPRTMLTRGDLSGDPVAAVWVPDRGERYVRVGHLEFSIEDGTARIVPVLERHPDVIAEAPPGLTVAEWESTDLADGGEGWWV
jgi:hypothetical protein